MHPQAEQQVNFLRKFVLGRGGWRVGVVNLAVLACVFRTTTKKVINFFEEKKYTPKKILATLVAQISSKANLVLIWSPVQVQIRKNLKNVMRTSLSKDTSPIKS